jgi:hypothetical protein
MSLIMTEPVSDASENDELFEEESGKIEVSEGWAIQARISGQD